ncbi:hypothetical protein M422DRAFT_33805, partial [Sphaerobolus stellatus SS14]
APFAAVFPLDELLIPEVEVEADVEGKVVGKGNEEKGDEEKGEEKESALELPGTTEDKTDEDAKDGGAVVD